MAGGGVPASQVFYQSARLLGIGPVKGRGLPEVRWFLRDGRWIIAPTVFYRKKAAVRGENLPARYKSGAKRGKRRKSLRLPIKSAARPSIEAKGFRKLQKVFFSFPREGDAAALSGKAAKGCAVDRARPAKVSREAARGPSGGFSLFLRSEKEKMGCIAPAIIMAEIPPPVRARTGLPCRGKNPPYLLNSMSFARSSPSIRPSSASAAFRFSAPSR